MSRPSTMRASVLRAAGDIVIEEREVPTPAPDDVLVRVEAVGVCGSDVHYYRHGRVGEFIVEKPLVLGHEAAGTVVEVGAAAPAELLGARVSIEPGIPCRACEQCRRGSYNLCPDVRFFATPPIDGAFVEYVAVPADFVSPLPDSVSTVAGALLEPLSVAYWACRKAGVGPGMRVLVTGAGPVGLLTLQVARALGCGDITVSDISEERLATAVSLGAARVHRADDGALTEADVLIECSGAPSAVQAGIRALGAAGRAVLVGMGADEVTIPASHLQRHEITVTGTFRYASTWPAALDLAASGAVTLDALATSAHPLADVATALDLNPGGGHIKAIVEPHR
jgi:L-iditol 2-dehydrogenase